MRQLIDLKVGSSCNNKCVHCCAASEKRDRNLSLNDIKLRIEEFISLHESIDLTLTGGEITVRKDFVKIMEFVKGKKNAGLIGEVHLQTNGRKLSDIEKLNSSVDVVDYYLIALHAHEANIHDNITAIDGSFDETVSAIKQLTAKVPAERIAIQTVINKFNYRYLKETYSFAHEKFGISEFNITFPHPMGAAYDTKITPSYNDVKIHVNKAMDYFFENNLKPLPEALPLCIFDDTYREYVADVELSRMTNAVGYDQNGELLNYQELSDLAHMKYSKCQTCSETERCHGVWNEYIALYPDEGTIPNIISNSLN